MYPLQHHILIQLNNRLYLDKAIINFNVFVLTSSGSEKSLICESFYVIKPGIFITNIMGKRNLKIYIVNWTSWSKIYKRFSWPSLGGTIMEHFCQLVKITECFTKDHTDRRVYSQLHSTYLQSPCNFTCSIRTMKTIKSVYI